MPQELEMKEISHPNLRTCARILTEITEFMSIKTDMFSRTHALMAEAIRSKNRVVFL